MKLTRWFAVLFAALLFSAVAAPSVSAEPPTRVRTLTCSDGTIFVGEHTRGGIGVGRDRPPMWRNVEPGAHPSAFVFHGVILTRPDGTVDEALSWDQTHGVSNRHEIITCSLIIPVGPLAGYRADFLGYFVP